MSIIYANDCIAADETFSKFHPLHCVHLLNCRHLQPPNDLVRWFCTLSVKKSQQIKNIGKALFSK